MMVKVCILDYGSGNVKSVYNMIKILTSEVVVSNSSNHIQECTHLILPGVGAFGASMKKINDSIPFDVLSNNVVKQKKPFLGICVGMQVLAQKGFEHGEYSGFGWIDGEVDLIKSGQLVLPHVGWNTVTFSAGSVLGRSLGKAQDFYFVHSYVFTPNFKTDIAGTFEYSENCVAIVQRDNIFGVQFHPEKSQKAGKQIIKNFLDYKAGEHG